MEGLWTRVRVYRVQYRGCGALLLCVSGPEVEWGECEEGAGEGGAWVVDGAEVG